MGTRIAVLGSGAWGTAVALLLARRPEHDVRLWSARADNGAELARYRENVRLLPGVRLPECVRLTLDPAEAAADADLLVVGVPTVYLRETLSRVAPHCPAGTPAVSLTKGLENETFLRPTEILVEALGPRPVAALSGPSHAEEVACGRPTSVVVASQDEPLAAWVQGLFNNETFRVYTNSDVVGVELAGALKNVLAIAAGIGDGLGLGDNAKSALLTRGLVEMARFGVRAGGRAQTFYGLAGLGDLITTCVSPHGRNRRVGERLGRGETLPDILAGSPMVAEGVTTCRSVHARARQWNVDTPIVSAVHAVLYEGLPPRVSVLELMSRQPTSEEAGPLG
jgi:glycerol-3-phosphate dehydrogenase (NAD(P)+)